jgi:hypothetical protein
MAQDASHALGAAEVVGTMVNPAGFAKKATVQAAGRVAAGVAGHVAARAAVGSETKAGDLPEFGRVAYLALSEAEVALVKTKTGAFKMGITDQVIARAPRAEVVSSELEEGKLLSHLRIAFANGVAWEFDIPRSDKKTAKGVVQALRGASG